MSKGLYFACNISDFIRNNVFTHWKKIFLVDTKTQNKTKQN